MYKLFQSLAYMFLYFIILRTITPDNGVSLSHKFPASDFLLQLFTKTHNLSIGYFQTWFWTEIGKSDKKYLTVSLPLLPLPMNAKSNNLLKKYRLNIKQHWYNIWCYDCVVIKNRKICKRQYFIRENHKNTVLKCMFNISSVKLNQKSSFFCYKSK